MGAVIESCVFSFSCGAYCHFEDSCDHHDWGVDYLCVDAVVAKVHASARTAACFWCNTIGGVTVTFKCHVYSMTCDM